MSIINSPITVEDLLSSNFETIVENLQDQTCDGYYSAYSTVLKEAKEIGDEKKTNIFRFLSSICSFHLVVDDPKKVLDYMIVWGDGTRSAGIEDLNDMELDILEQIVEAIENPELRSRIADVLVLRKRKFYKHAVMAIDSYLKSAKRLKLTEGAGAFVYSQERVKRANQLALSLGKAGEIQKQKVFNIVEEWLSSYANYDDSFFSAWLMEILIENGLGHPKKYSEFSERCALQAETEHNWHRARIYWKIKSDWNKLQGEEENFRNALIKYAETFVGEAQEKLHLEKPDYFLATHFLEKAIQSYRQVPLMPRERIEDLHRLLLSIQPQAMDSMSIISGEIEIPNAQDIMNKVHELVSDRTFIESLMNLAMLIVSPSKQEVRNIVVENSHKFVVQAMVAKEIVNQKGKVVAIRPSLTLGSEEEKEMAIRADMIEQIQKTQGLTVNLWILPAIEQINLEHYYTWINFLPLLRHNPFVPLERIEIFARGLYSGLRGDLIESLSLLIPQLENSLRYLLEEAGQVVSSLDADGIQEEFDINRILTDSKLVKILDGIWGEDITFDLRGLLVDKYGLNLRNVIAHGLLDSKYFYSLQSVYLFWLILRIIVLPKIIMPDEEAENN